MPQQQQQQCPAAATVSGGGAPVLSPDALGGASLGAAASLGLGGLGSLGSMPSSLPFMNGFSQPGFGSLGGFSMQVSVDYAPG